MGFGDFSAICSKTPLPLCSVVKSAKHILMTNGTVISMNEDQIGFGIVPMCYARPIYVANTMIFSIGNAFVNIGTLFILLVILFNVRSKFTAIGRSEYAYFYQLFFVTVVMTLVVDCGVSPPGSGSYPYLVAVQLGLASACCWSLAVMGFLGFRLWEDGTLKSMFFVCGSSLIGFALTFIISILSFKKWLTGVNDQNTNTMALFVVLYILNVIALAIYVVCLLVVAIVVVKNYWAMGSILLGLFFFIAGQVLTYAISNEICNGFNHYLDGLFFGSLCNTIAVMMIYKTWDITTDDDLEFSVRIDVNGDIVYGNKDT